MEQLAIHNYLNKFFTLNKCEIQNNQLGKLTVKLTENIDRLLMNRPFYWDYIKKIGQDGEPATLTFISNPKLRDQEGEWIHYGSPRLHQIFQSQLLEGKFTLLYEGGQKEALKPWLITNIKVSYKGRQKKDEILSIGLQLINGMMILPVMEKLNQIKDFSCSNMISDYCFTISPIIKIPSGYKRIEQYVKEYIHNLEQDWVYEALKYFEEEREILTHFYETYLTNAEPEEQEAVTSRYKSELEDLQKRLLPEIHVEVINGGLFYLSDNTGNTLMQ